VLSAGRTPQAAHEITIAPTTADRLGVSVGSHVELVGSSGTRTFDVVGIGFVPTSVETQYHEGAWVTPAAIHALFDVPGLHLVLVEVDRGVDDAGIVGRIVADVDAERPDTYVLAGNIGTPDDIDQDAVAAAGQLSNVRLVPRWLALFLVALAIGAVGHTVVATVRRRAGELAVLRALGLTPSQGRAAVVVQVVIVAVIGLAAGVPLGWIGGRALWRVVASYTPLDFSAPDPAARVLVVVPAVFLLAVLLAAVPAYRAGRLPVSTILRAE
jgi:ABC-type lipoprotein release transport system permease subunit